MAKLTLTANDDAAQDTDTGSVATGNSTETWGDTSANKELIGFRFTGVTIAQGATVHKATLKVHMASITTATTEVSVKVQAADNAAAFTTTSNDISGRTFNTAANFRIHDLGDGFKYIDITDGVQSVINRAGWASGNAIVVVLDVAPGNATAAATISMVESANDPQIAIVSGGTATAWTSFGSNTGSFTNPGNASADDGVYATTTNLTTATHTFYNFGFSIPAGATIDDVIVRAQGKCSSNASRARWGMELTVNGGTNWATQKFTNQLYDTADTEHYFGGDPDEWSIFPTVSQINDNTNFRVRIQNDFGSSTNDADLDYLAVKVCYTVSGTSYTQTLTDTITYTDTLVKQGQKALLDTVTFTDTLTRLGTFLRTLTDTVTFSDTITKLTGKPLSETITFSDVLTSIKTVLKELTETITYTDTLIKTIIKTLSDTVTFSDVLNKLTGKNLTETTTLSDTVIKQTGKNLTDTITTSDTLNKTTGKVQSETLTLTDTLTKQTGKVQTETVTLTDSLTKLTSKVLSDTVTLTDVLDVLKIVGVTVKNYYTGGIAAAKRMMRGIGF